MENINIIDQLKEKLLTVVRDHVAETQRWKDAADDVMVELNRCKEENERLLKALKESQSKCQTYEDSLKSCFIEVNLLSSGKKNLKDTGKSADNRIKDKRTTPQKTTNEQQKCSTDLVPTFENLQNSMDDNVAMLSCSPSVPDDSIADNGPSQATCNLSKKSDQASNASKRKNPRKTPVKRFGGGKNMGPASPPTQRILRSAVKLAQLPKNNVEETKGTVMTDQEAVSISLKNFDISFDPDGMDLSKTEETNTPFVIQVPATSSPIEPVDNPLTRKVHKTPIKQPVSNLNVTSTEKGIDKATFLSEMKLADTTRRVLTRSRSSEELSMYSSSHNISNISKRRFFTPKKMFVDVPDPSLRATWEELCKNHELHDKLARSINNALEEVPVPAESAADDELDRALQSIVDKTSADPDFNSIMSATLSAFDLSSFLKPLDSADKEKKEPKAAQVVETVAYSGMSYQPVDCNILTGSLAAKPKAKRVVDTVAYSGMSYQPVDVNILTGSLDEEGNCIFHAHPSAVASNPLFLPPAPLATKRFRNILPKFGKITVPNTPPVVVITPIMEPSIPKNMKGRGQKTTKGRTLNKRKKMRQKSSTQPPPTAQPTPALPSPTEQPTAETPSVRDMPSNLLATPVGHPTLEKQKPPAAVSISKKLSNSTQPHKSHVRALEFATPVKKSEVIQPKTSPKVVPEVEKPSDERVPPVATLTPCTRKPSGAWEDGVNCIFDPEKNDKSAQNQPKSWDADLRVNIDQSAPPENIASTKRMPKKPTKKGMKSSTKKGKKSSTKKGKKSSTKKGMKSSIEIDKTKKALIKKSQMKKLSPKKTCLKKKKKIERKLLPPRSKRPLTTPCSPSKKRNTSKRTTYSISEFNTSVETAVEDTSVLQQTPSKETKMSPLSKTASPIGNGVAFDDYSDSLTRDITNPSQVTPFTKLLLGNVPSVDMDISMLATPCFPTTPNCQVTPVPSRPSDYSSTCSSYYKPELTSPCTPRYEFDVPKLQRSEEHLQDISTASGRNLVQSPELKSSSEDEVTLQEVSVESRRPLVQSPKTRSSTHKKINDVVVEVKKIAAACSSKRKVPGKNMSFAKFQMIAQCEKKLRDNVVEAPIQFNDGPNKGSEIICDPVVEGPPDREKSETMLQPKDKLKEKLETKRLRVILARREIENAVKRPAKPVEKPPKRRKMSSPTRIVKFSEPPITNTPSKAPPSEVPQSSGTSPDKAPSPLKSTPLKLPSVIKSFPDKVPFHVSNSPSKLPASPNKDSSKASVTVASLPKTTTNEMKEVVHKEFPSYVDDGMFPNLTISTKKKMFVVKMLLEKVELGQFLAPIVGRPLVLNPSVHQLYNKMYKWLRHPHKHELEASSDFREWIKSCTKLFRRIEKGIADWEASLVRSEQQGLQLPPKKRKNTQAEGAQVDSTAPNEILQNVDLDHFLIHHVHHLQSS